MMLGEQQDFAMRNAGFTLVELLVALAIMAVVSAIALPLYTQFSDRTFDQRTVIVVNLQEAETGVQATAFDLFENFGSLGHYARRLRWPGHRPA